MAASSCRGLVERHRRGYLQVRLEKSTLLVTLPFALTVIWTTWTPRAFGAEPRPMMAKELAMLSTLTWPVGTTWLAEKVPPAT